MNISKQLNQKFFGRKELEILNQKPKPPSIKTIRKPSDVDENYNNDEGVVGYMGNDEDLESIKYDIMDNMNQKMNNFDNRIEKLLNQIQTMDANKDKLNQLELEQESLLEVVEAEDNEIEAVAGAVALDGSGDINDIVDVIAGARPCYVLSQTQYTRNRIDSGEDPVCTRFYRRGSGEDGVVGSYHKYEEGNNQYGRSCKAYYHGSVNNPIVEDPPNYCKDYNGKVAQKCNTIIGHPSPSPEANCVEFNSTTNRDQQLWVDKCSQYSSPTPCNESDDCIFRNIGDEGRCIFNCAKLSESLLSNNINNNLQCKRDSEGYYESSPISLSNPDTTDSDVLQDYCEQFISKETCNSDNLKKCRWDNDLDVLDYDFKCIPRSDSTTCNLSSPFRQLLIDSGAECKSLTSSPCCDVFSEVCSYENETCSSSLPLSWDPRYYNLWRLLDYILTLLFSTGCVCAYFYFKKPVKKILYIVIPLVVFLLNIGKIFLSVWIETYFDFINIAGKPTQSYVIFFLFSNVILVIPFLVLMGKGLYAGGGGGADGGGADSDGGIGMKGRIKSIVQVLVVIFVFILVGYSASIVFTNKVKNTICDTDIAYKKSHKITEYCNSINKSYDRTPEYNIAQGDDDTEFNDKCTLPCKKYSNNNTYQRWIPLITCFVIIIISFIGLIKMEGKLKKFICSLVFLGSIILIIAGNINPVCKAKNKDDSEKCNSITNSDYCKAALHRDGGVNEDKDNKDNKDKNICFLYHGPYLTYFSGKNIGLSIELIVGVIILCFVFLVIVGSYEEIIGKARMGGSRILRRQN